MDRIEEVKELWGIPKNQTLWRKRGFVDVRFPAEIHNRIVTILCDSRLTDFVGDKEAVTQCKSGANSSAPLTTSESRLLTLEEILSVEKPFEYEALATQEVVVAYIQAQDARSYKIGFQDGYTQAKKEIDKCQS